MAFSSDRFFLQNKKESYWTASIPHKWYWYWKVLQGSIFRPFLFFVYINNLSDNIALKSKLFTDASHLQLAVIGTSKDLRIIIEWVFQSKMKCNPDTTDQPQDVISHNFEALKLLSRLCLNLSEIRKYKFKYSFQHFSTPNALVETLSILPPLFQFLREKACSAEFHKKYWWCYLVSLYLIKTSAAILCASMEYLIVLR